MRNQWVVLIVHPDGVVSYTFDNHAKALATYREHCDFEASEYGSLGWVRLLEVQQSNCV